MSFIIIYPSELYNNKCDKYLNGIIQNKCNCTYIYILNNISNKSINKIQNIGFCKYKSKEYEQERIKHQQQKSSHPSEINNQSSIWIELSLTNNQSINITKLIRNSKQFDIRLATITFVEYNKTAFYTSKLLGHTNISETGKYGSKVNQQLSEKNKPDVKSESDQIRTGKRRKSKRLQVKQNRFEVFEEDILVADQIGSEPSEKYKYNQEKTEINQLDFEINEDCFQLLYKFIRCDSTNLENDLNGHWLYLFLSYMIVFLQKILNISKFVKIFTFSSLYKNFVDVFEYYLWLALSIKSKRNILKVLNCVTCLVFDMLFGIYLLQWFHYVINTEDELFTLVSQKCEFMVGKLHDLIVWLQGNPAGLKLNHPLTYLLGKFFIYHIQLWWSFLVLSRPLLEFMFHAYLIIGYFGFTFQLSILSDLLTLASFHVYCVYVYAAKLFNIQLQSLLVLARVFIGKKRNPEPGKVDSVPYTTEQLFIGTIAFTVLLFLLPTTLVYYVVFTTIRLILVCVEGLLVRIKLSFQTLPIYVAVLYLTKSPQTTSTIKVTPKIEPNSRHVHVRVEPVQQSLMTTLQMTIPDPLNKTNSIQWSKLLKNIATGNLIYPIK